MVPIEPCSTIWNILGIGGSWLIASRSSFVLNSISSMAISMGLNAIYNLSIKWTKIKSRVWRKIDLLLTTTILKETPRKLHAAVNSYKSVLIVEISIHQSLLIIHRKHHRKMITQSGWVKVCATWNVKPLSFSTLHLIIGCIFSILFYIHFSIHFLRC